MADSLPEAVSSIRNLTMIIYISYVWCFCAIHSRLDHIGWSGRETFILSSSRRYGKHTKHTVLTRPSSLAAAVR